MYIQRRGRGSKGRPQQFPQQVEEYLMKEVQRLRAENEYLKNCRLWFWREHATPAEKVTAIQELRQEYDLAMLLESAQLPRATFYYHAKRIVREYKYVCPHQGKDYRTIP